MAQLTLQKVTTAGITPTYQAAAAGGDSFANNGRQFFVVKNGGATSVTVTINSQRPCNQGFDHDLTVEVAASGEKWIGPLDPARFDDEEGNVQVTYSGVDSVTVAAISI